LRFIDLKYIGAKTSGALERSADFEKFKDKYSNRDPLVWIIKQVKMANKLSDVSDLINFLNEQQAYQTVHLGICSLDGVPVKDTIHNCPISGTGLSLLDFPESRC